MTDLIHSRYRLIEVLGRGAMGVVWRAEDETLHRHVAIKELSAGPEVDPVEAADRFLIEAQAVARVSHPNIVTIHDVLADGDRVLIVMELVAGPTVAEVVRTSGAQPTEMVRAVMAQVAHALAAAHASGVVHRDLKPENVFWTPDGRAVVADFGLARIGAGRGTVEGTVMGTPGYMAPEQVRGLAIGPPADVFGWGVLAYELATGRPPFGEPSMTDPGSLAYRIVHEPPPLLVVSDDPDLVAAILHALAKNPEDRPQHGSALVAELDGSALVTEMRRRRSRGAREAPVQQDPRDVASESNAVASVRFADVRRPPDDDPTSRRRDEAHEVPSTAVKNTSPRSGRRLVPSAVGLIVATVAITIAVISVLRKTETAPSTQVSAVTTAAATTPPTTSTSVLSTTARPTPASTVPTFRISTLPFEDDFSIARGWSRPGNSGSAHELAGGEFRVTFRPGAAQSAYIAAPVVESGNLRISVDVGAISNDQVSAGLYCGGGPGGAPRPVYNARIGTGSQWMIWKWDEGSPSGPRVLASGRNPAVQRSGWNHLELECFGGGAEGGAVVLRLAVNGQFLGEGRDQQGLSLGRIGLNLFTYTATTEDAMVQFDNFAVSSR